jgi:CubicO group peptidase (beta-lactamase class C family)
MTKSSIFRKLGVKRAGCLLALACVLAAGAWWMGGEKRVPDRERVPGRHWSRLDPVEAGFSTDRLDAIAAEVRGAGCMVQGGQLVYEWGDTLFLNDVASSIKTFYTFWVLQAVQNGRLQSLDDRVMDWIPALAILNDGLGFKDREITFRHLLEQTSGYGLSERPGEAFAYNDFGTGLLTWTVLNQLSGLPPEQVDELLNGTGLGKVIGFEHQPTLLHPFSKDSRIRISAKDLARFGLLFLRGGQWDGTVVLREDLFDLALTPPRRPRLPRTAGVETEHWDAIPSFGGGLDLKDSLGCLGYYWWFNHETGDGTRLLPAAPPGTFMGMGYGGRFCFILIPELDLEIVWVDIHRGEQWSPFDTVGRFRVNELLGQFLQARTEPTP